MAKEVKTKPDEYHTVTPALIVTDSAKAVVFYEKAFGAKPVSQMAAPDGKGTMHAEIRIGDSSIMLADEAFSMGGKAPSTTGAVTGSLHVYVPDVDAVYERAVKAGAKSLSSPEDMFWGDRYARVKDPFGHEWGLATRVEEVSPSEMEKRGRAWAAQVAANRPR